MKKVFLDVGSHWGQTLDEVIKSNYNFDKIYSFEPMLREYNVLVQNYSKYNNIVLCNYGLLDKTDIIPIYGTNDNMAASIFKNKNDVDNPNSVHSCLFKNASQFFKDNINQDDINIMKLNCEGSECIILNNLIDSEEIWKLSNVMIDFDIKKVPGKEHEADLLINRFNQIGFNKFSLCENVMIGLTHQNRIENWLKSTKLI